MPIIYYTRQFNVGEIRRATQFGALLIISCHKANFGMQILCARKMPSKPSWRERDRCPGAKMLLNLTNGTGLLVAFALCLWCVMWVIYAALVHALPILIGIIVWYTTLLPISRHRHCHCHGHGHCHTLINRRKSRPSQVTQYWINFAFCTSCQVQMPWTWPPINDLEAII